MPLLEQELLRCEQCGTFLESEMAAAACLNCLLGGGLSESGTESRRFQHYELCLREDESTLDELGRGAMGVTYRARDLNLDSLVALKVISAAYSDKPEARERFRREARAAAQLRHPSVASVFHFGETNDGQCFYAMELLEGETLEARVRRDGPLTTSSTLDVAEQVCRALIAAEAHKLIHRDLKPSNLMVVSNDFAADAPLVKVIDFGLAQAVVALQEIGASGHPSFSGTPEFASPEQFSRTSLDARSDIYSLGATLWYLLCGKAPFTGSALKDVRDQQLHRPLPLEQLTAAKVPSAMVKLLHSMLATDQGARPQSARELLSAVRACRESIEGKSYQRHLALVGCVVGLLILGGVALARYQLRRERAAGISITTSLPEKSIAVLPFENLSTDRENFYFATAVQDEILSDLAKIADLKVISRTSVSQYPGGAPRNIREIGRALGVAHVLEGSVQRVANRARVNAQLIDTRTDAHLWAQTFDREAADVFAIQDEIAQKIADQLQGKISSREKAAMEERPTRDLAAYNLYAEATCLIDAAPYEESEEPKKKYLRAVELLNQAIARDPAFLLAYCRLAEADDELYFSSFDRTSRRLELGKSAINSAFRLQPDSPEAHVAMAHHLYHCYFDYDRARDELEIGRRSLPNEARIFDWSGLIDRRQNRWHDSIRNLNRAVDLDPQNPKILADLERTYWLVRDYKKCDELHNRIAALKPSHDPEMSNAWHDVVERADTRALHAVLKSKAPDDQGFVDDRFQLALYERDAVVAKRELPAVVAHPGDFYDLRGVGSARFNRDYLEGLIARMKGDTVGAQAAFTAARAKQEESYRAHPEVQSNLCVLGLIDAGLGQKKEALREGGRAVELAVPEKEALDAADVVYYYAAICGWVGERDLAIEQLQASAEMPAGVSYMEIRLDPHWDPIRDDPRFDKIAASLAPPPR